MKAICGSAKLLLDTIREAETEASAQELPSVHRELAESFEREQFHCAHDVLRELRDLIGSDPRLTRATLGFQGGTLTLGRTCSALTAGVIALGLRNGQIESSRSRVLCMVAKMACGGDAMADSVNGFNPAINAGNRLVAWFHGEFGTTRCRDIIGMDPAAGASIGIETMPSRIGRCRQITRTVGKRVRDMLVQATTTVA